MDLPSERYLKTKLTIGLGQHLKTKLTIGLGQPRTSSRSHVVQLSPRSGSLSLVFGQLTDKTIMLRPGVLDTMGYRLALQSLFRHGAKLGRIRIDIVLRQSDLPLLHHPHVDGAKMLEACRVVFPDRPVADFSAC